MKSGYKSFAETDADYTILSTHFMSKKYVKKFFPPVGTIKVETINGKPIAAVVKRDKLDSEGIKLLQQNKYREGMALLDSAYKKNPNNFGIYFWMGYGSFNINEYKKAIEYFKKAEEFDLSEDQIVISKMLTGVSLYSIKSYDNAIKTLKMAEGITKKEDQKSYIWANIALSYFNKKDYKNAIPYFEKALARHPYFQGNLNYCYSKVGR